ncbi:MAG TPA: aminotransferase class V-fold PLP-dependent enzyme, partial [Mycobacteriales bacterium]|nr:aminotransferase class V-fold PLP-dependent enzyme [Mycobacteriales bacterium]
MSGLVPREQFALDPDVSYWNHGGYGAVPRPVTAAQERLRAGIEANPTRAFGPGWAELVAPSRERAAQLLRARPADVLPVANATTGTQTVLASLTWSPGDRVVVTDHAYPGVAAQVARLVARHGVEAVIVPTEPVATLAARVAGVLDERTRLVVVDQVTSPSALVLPVADIARAAHALAVPVLVDAAHAPGQLELDVPELGVDYWTGNLHKWAAVPRACGVLWVAPAVRAGLVPLLPSVGHLFASEDAEYGWPGTHDPTPWLAVPAGLDWLADVGADRLRAHAAGMLGEATARVTEVLAGCVVSDPHPPCMVALALPLRLDDTVARAVMDACYRTSGVELVVSQTPGHSYLRLCAYAYTDE